MPRMEPLSAATTIGKLLSTGYSLYKALQGGGDDFELDLKAYESLVELGGQLGSWTPKDVSEREGAQALALLTIAFGKAFHECFGALKAFDDQKHLQANLTAAVEWAKPGGPSDPKTPPLSLAEVFADPEKTPYFAALWSAFTRRNLPGKAGRGDTAWFAEPLIEEPNGAARARFEQVFRTNVGALLASPNGRDLSLALLRADQDAERARWVERLLVGDMATWDQRHVFGNVKGHETLPAMPLKIMYVESNGRLKKRGEEVGAAPICSTLHAELAKHTLIVVTADFGHGKSLTARTLAYQAAQQFLSDGSKPSAELVRPVFVKCQAAFSTSHIELARAVRRAQWLGLKDELGILELAEDDAALRPPSPKQRTLFLLDGLDEVAFLERDILYFFEHLRGQLTAHHRAIVFSRPHTLPTVKLEEWGIPVWELQPFHTEGEDLGQAGQWLAHWNACSLRPPIEPSALRRDGLEELARTPILLFMIAYTWGNLDELYAGWHPPETEQSDREQEPQAQPDPMEEEEAAWDRKHRIYEAFFRAIAWGKYERDRDAHPVILKAARALREALEARSLLAANEDMSSARLGNHQTDERDQLTSAMLWLMGRVAWQARCLQQLAKPKALTRSQVDHILDRELDLDDSKVADVARDGLLLAMQADLSESSRPILFGHQSFREFLVARCWAELLRVLTEPETKPEQKTGLIWILRGGRLRDGEDHSFDFLRARLRQWNRAEQRRLYEWALAEFENDGMETQQPTLRADLRRHFRETALALASVVVPSEGLLIRDVSHLRSLLASYWIAGESGRLWAPRLQAKGAVLPGANLPGANLAGAGLSMANLPGANLPGANLSEANLADADLAGANLPGANFSGANLSEADLAGANLTGANLSGANLSEADLTKADLTGANLSEADLTKADLSGADLSGANLSGAKLTETDVRRADLSGANLSRAKLIETDLRRADLSGVNLAQTSFADVLLDGTIVDAAVYTYVQEHGALPGSSSLRS